MTSTQRVNMSKEFSGKVVLITGAGSGLGAGTAIHFSTLGASLVLVDLNLESIQKVSQQCTQEDNQKHLLIQANITIEDDLTRIINQTIQHFGKLDVLVNNAGLFVSGTLENSKVEQFDKIINTNLRAVYQLTQLAAPHLIATKGNIVNLSSLSATRAFADNLIYGMSKKAVDQLTECVALDLAPKQVRVNCVNPALVPTNIFIHAGFTAEQSKAKIESIIKDGFPLGRVGRVEDVAQAIAFLASDKASFITRVHLPIDGGKQVCCPR